MKSGIYKIECLPTGKVYVGSAVKLITRFAVHRHALRRHKHHSSKLQNAWNKYGENAFRFEILLLCDKENLIMYEQIHIDFFDSVKKGFNIEPIAASSLGRKHSLKTRKRLSEIRKDAMTPERRKKIGEQHKGLKHSKETLAKMRKAASKIPYEIRIKVQAISAASRRKNGYNHSEATKEKIRIAAIGRKASAEARAKMSAVRIGMKYNVEKQRESAIVNT